VTLRFVISAVSGLAFLAPSCSGRSSTWRPRPCHQSQFPATEYARPIFGPATRPLAQLPIAVHDEGYLVARNDFAEPVGPAFWERRYNQ
jgi:hypothetical protein